MLFVKKMPIFLLAGFITIIEILLWIPSYIYRSVVILVVKIFRKDIGNIADPFATLFDDNYSQNKTNLSIISILEIGGDLSLTQVRNIVQKNLLQGKIVTNKGVTVLHYPELTQCQVSFMGYRFWKPDMDFHIENHVVEEENLKREKVTTIHKIMLNKVYPDERSPWELVIVRNHQEFDDQSKTLLILRIHHSMADGKSVVKLLVEGLGQQKLNTANAIYTRENFWGRVGFYVSVPYNLTRINQWVLETQLKTKKHSWSVTEIYDDQTAILTSMSEKLPKNELKLFAEKNGVRMSSVILLIITNTIRSFHRKTEEMWNESLPVYCMLPKEGHPDFLRNHLYLGLPNLPVDEPSEEVRLHKCENLYNKLRSSSIPRSFEVMIYLVSAWVSLLRYRLAPVRAVSTVVSNIAGENVGFHVGSFPCTDFTMTVGFRPSSIGVQFFALSYKFSIRVSVQAKDSVMDNKDIELLADLIGMECSKLLMC